MNSSFITQLFELLLSPVAILGIIVGLVVVLQASRSRILSWYLLSLCCFSSSLSKFQDEFVTEPPALAFPLQQLREFGRPITIICLGLLLLITFFRQSSWRQRRLAEPIQYLAIVQVIVFCKTLYAGDILFALISAFTFAVLLLIIKYGPSLWLTDHENFEYAVRSIALVGTIFLGINAYQAAIDMYPITFVHGRFLGTTGNPQHAALLLASVIPCFMFLFEIRQQKFQKFVAAMGLGGICLALMMTGSRTGLLMGISILVCFYGGKGKSLLRLCIFLGGIAAITLPFAFQDGALFGVQQASVSARYLSIENTRSQVWLALWRAFSQNPIFGLPLAGQRLGFGESSWLAAGASLGLAGLVPLIMFGASSIKLVSNLMSVCRRQPGYQLHCNTVIAGTVCLLVGSFFEAFLLGNLSSALLILLIYLSLGQYLLDLSKVELNHCQHLNTSSKLSLFTPIR